MATQPQTGLTYADLQRFPEDNLRRELIDGELIVTAAPGRGHQNAVLRLGAALLAYVDEHGGAVYVAPREVFLTDRNVVEPDVVFLRSEHLGRDEEPFVRGAPDLVVEVSSPSTRRLELVRKLELYERFAVGEYWYVDLDADRVEVYRPTGERYGPPVMATRGEVLSSPVVPGFSIDVDDLVGPLET
ncbi:MAG: Uma2 family endonuclease [Actinomycetota bacterium]